MGKKNRRSGASRRRAQRAKSEQRPAIIEAIDATTSSDVDADADAEIESSSSMRAAATAATSVPSSSPLVEVGRSALPRLHGSPPVPRAIRLALISSVGAALLSTGIASFVVFRDTDRTEGADLVRTAAAATMHAVDAEPIDTPPAAVAATDGTLAASSPTEPEPEADSDSSWPDLTLATLPPVGAAPESMGQSLGSPRDGALVAPMRLPNDRSYVIRNEHTAWGTHNTIEHLRGAITSVQRKNPAMPRVVVGDISTRRGGPLAGHTSHQSGRDVDLGLVHRGRLEDAPAEFVEATRDNLDKRLTYDLIAALAATRDDPTGVELIVLDYNLQRQLRRAASQRGIPEAELEALFQFPHGPESRHGLVRHMPAHRDHMHVRFRCPEGDRYCRSPLIGFGGMEAIDVETTP